MTRFFALLLLLPTLALGAVEVKGGVSGTKADVDATNHLKVAPDTAKAAAPYVMLKGDPGVAGSGYGVETTSSRRLMVGQDNWLFLEPVNGSTINGSLWTAPVTSFTIAQASGFITLNNAATLAANSVARLSSTVLLGHEGRSVLDVSFRATPINLAISNVTAELGIFTASGTTAPTDGVFFRWYSNGEFRAVVSFGGSETPSAALTVPTGSVAHSFKILLYRDDVHFFVDEVEVADIDVPGANPGPMVGKNPLAARVYVGGTAAASAPQLKIGMASAKYLGGPASDLPTTYGTLLRPGYQIPATSLQSTRIDHSTTNQTLVANTGPAATNVGGDFIFAAPAGATSEFPIFAYPVPAGFRLVCTSISITAVSYGAATATTPTILQWYAGVNDTASTLATADNTDFTTLATRRQPLGTQIFPISTQVGWEAQPIDRVFRTPLVAESNRYFHIILTVPVGTATASQVIRGTVTANCYFE